MNSFWKRLQKPFYAMGPMADVTDIAYRRLIAEFGKPDIFWTEFVSADGLYHTREIQKMPDDQNPLMRDLLFSPDERPIVAQIFSGKPEMIAYASGLVAQLGFDGVDINMGCPDKSIEKQGAGAALIKDFARAVELINAAKNGANYSGRSIPVSVKTRIGYNSEIIDKWIPTLLSAEPAAITVHLRTRKEMSHVSAHWELMNRVVSLRDAVGVDTLILGNGDVKDIADAKKKVKETSIDGVMFGRAIFGNPWFFNGASFKDVSSKERLAALITLCQYFSEIEPAKHFNIFKKHIKAFVTGFNGAAEIRAELMKAKSPQEFKTMVMKCDVPF